LGREVEYVVHRESFYPPKERKSFEELYHGWVSAGGKGKIYRGMTVRGKKPQSNFPVIRGVNKA